MGRVKKRVAWIIKHPIQAKYLTMIVAAMVLPTAVIGYFLYRLMIYTIADQLAFPEAIAANIAPAVMRVNGVLLLILPVTALIFLWLAIIISHRFGGPIERLERELDQILGGDLTHRIRMRDSDDLSGVAKRINKVVDVIRKHEFGSKDR